MSHKIISYKTRCHRLKIEKSLCHIGILVYIVIRFHTDTAVKSPVTSVALGTILHCTLHTVSKSSCSRHEKNCLICHVISFYQYDTSVRTSFRERHHSCYIRIYHLNKQQHHFISSIAPPLIVVNRSRGVCKQVILIGKKLRNGRLRFF